ncbi:MAG: arylesterase [Verrucomicrobiaceae bacterium]|nr:MAG: arylesterase [Verrucomicrobiaceae bacterium]
MKWLALALLVMIGTGAGVSTATGQNANGGKKRLVVLGDSITAGYGLDGGTAEAYPALIQKKIDDAGLAWTVVNAGVSGDTTAGGLRRIDWALGKDGADVLLIALGGNDGLRGISPDQTEKNLLGIVAKARAKNPEMKIAIAGMQMPDNMGPDYTTSFKAVFPKVAGAEKAALVPFLLEGVGGDPEMNQDDRIHPTAEGQKVISGHVWEVLKGLL